MAFPESKIFKYPWYWSYRYFLHVVFAGIGSKIIELIFSHEPNTWIKLWVFLIICIVMHFFMTLKTASAIEVFNDKITLHFNILRSYTFTLGQVTIKKESKPGKVKNAYGSEELTFIDGKRVAYVPLKMKGRNDFFGLVNKYITE